MSGRPAGRARRIPRSGLGRRQEGLEIRNRRRADEVLDQPGDAERARLFARPAYDLEPDRKIGAQVLDRRRGGAQPEHVDDDALLISEYVRCLGEDFEPDSATATLTDLEKVLFGEETDERGAVKFDVHSRNQGEAAVEAVESAIENGKPFSIVFLDIRMPPGMDGIEAAKEIRLLDPNVNIVIVTGSVSPTPENLGNEIPPADKVFFFQRIEYPSS